MNEQGVVQLGRIDYLKGRYIKPKNIPSCYKTYPNPYEQYWKDYDTGWHYERSLLPDLHPNLESIYFFGSYNFGSADFRKDWKAGYRAAHAGNPLEELQGEDLDKVREGWYDGLHIKQLASKQK